jgi:5-methyltetrahydropteroyltriglutamate--homocysteine methyltransferase
MRDKYRAIVEPGFVLQIDDPGITTLWDMLKPEPSLADYRKYVTLRIEALNHALAGIPPEKVRYHWCWGSWHGAPLCCTDQQPGEVSPRAHCS